MELLIKILAAIFGLAFIGIGLQWGFMPEQAGAPLGYSIPTGMGLSSMLADVGGFFLGAGIMVVLGFVTKNGAWFQAAGLLVAVAAVMRLLAWGLHGAPFATQFIAVEVIMTIVMLLAAKHIAKPADS